MAFPLTTETLARGSARRPWFVVGGWLVALVAFIVLAGALLSDALVVEFVLTNDSDSVVAEQLFEDRLSGPRKSHEIVVVSSDSLTVEDEQFRQKVEAVYVAITGLGEDIVEGGTHYYLERDESLVSADRRTTVVPITMAVDLPTAGDNVGEVHDVVSAADGQGGFEVLLTGQSTVARDAQEISKSDAETGESIAIPVAMVILVLVFGALVAAVVPLIVAVMSILIALGIVAVIGLAYEFSLYVTNMITIVGLAVGIDYSLFTVYRYRTERRRGLEKIDAIARTGATANRAVFFSGMTVVLALSGMLLIPINMFNSLAAGAILVVSVAVLASLTLIPAVLSLLGDKVDRLRVPIIGGSSSGEDPERQGTFWDRTAHAVMKRPVISMVAAGGLLALAAVPFFDMDIGFASVSGFPDDAGSKKGFNVVAREFPDLLTNRARIAIDGAVDDPKVMAAIDDLTLRLEADDSFGASELEVNDDRDLALLSAAVVGGDATSDAAVDAVNRLRDTHIPGAFGGVSATALVAGDTAFWIDFFEVTREYAVIVIAFILGVSFLLLTVVFRSIVVAFKAMLLNLLSVGATYGLIVLVFQKGVGNELLGFHQSGNVESWLPLFLFAVLFGLSMDYHIFLLSRIRERYDETQDNAESVAFGIRSTGRLITGAALIMVAVFSGFAFGARLVDLQQFGFGMGVAVLMDATIVRMVLVPSAMALLGDANWYLPSWLRWLPDFRVEVQEPSAVPATGGD